MRSKVTLKGGLVYEANGTPTNGNTTQTNEAVLLRRAIAGDQMALEILFAKNNRSLCQTAIRVLGNREDAEDALQEGMLAAYRNLRHFEGRSQFSTWLTRIVINVALMRRRSHRRKPAMVSLDECYREEQVPAVDRFPDDGPSPEEIIYAGYELGERLRKNLERLSPVLRRAFELRSLGGFTADEAARALGVSRNTLKVRVTRARRQLATRLRVVSHFLFQKPTLAATVVQRHKPAFRKDNRRKHRHYRVTVLYRDGEKFARVYSDRAKAAKFAGRQKKSSVVKATRVREVGT